MRLILGECLEKLREMEDNSVDSIVTDPPYGLSFMGKKWDYDVPSTEIWKECLRVLKPGGHLLSFAGSRTYHRMAVNIEDAGFEIRDQLMWIYGSGFPKSHNIGKNVDKKLGNERVEVDYIAPDGRKRWGGNSFSVGEEPDGRGVNKKTKGNSKWEGWGTALKPAHEPIVMARKPLSEKTIVDNVLEWGTGGINIDESRVEYINQEDRKSVDRSDRKVMMGWKTDNYVNGEGKNTLPPEQAKGNDTGRFPANILLSEEAAENLNQSTEPTKGNKKPRRYGENNFTSGGLYAPEGNVTQTYNDEGGVSRYFYVVKPSKKEKTKGLDKNVHPTVKPIKLMEYLVKMVTPVGGTTLDPFMGSGTTGISALTNGFDFIGIEREQEYMEIARQRIEAWTKEYQTKLEI